jgi:hypothetical protein
MKSPLCFIAIIVLIINIDSSMPPGIDSLECMVRAYGRKTQMDTISFCRIDIKPCSVSSLWDSLHICIFDVRFFDCSWGRSVKYILGPPMKIAFLVIWNLLS